MGQTKNLRYHPNSYAEAYALTDVPTYISRYNGRTRLPYPEKPDQITLRSPFTIKSTTAITPSMRLSVCAEMKVTTLRHRFTLSLDEF